MNTNAARDDIDFFGARREEGYGQKNAQAAPYLLHMTIPKNMNDIKDAAKRISNDTAILIKTDDLDDATLVRAIDYLRGFMDSCQGQVKRTSSNVIMIAPYSVTVIGSVDPALYGISDYDDELGYEELPQDEFSFPDF